MHKKVWIIYAVRKVLEKFTIEVNLDKKALLTRLTHLLKLICK